MTEKGQTWSIRPQKRGKMAKAQIHSAIKYLQKRYEKLNPNDTLEKHRSNPECQEVWDCLSCLSQTLYIIDEYENGEEDWSGARETTGDEDQ